jgi:hypothetical protein
MQTLAVAVYNHYMRIAHEEARRKAAAERAAASDAGGGPRMRGDGAPPPAADDPASLAAAAAAGLAGGERPSAQTNADGAAGRRAAAAAATYPAAVTVPTPARPLEQWGCAPAPPPHLATFPDLQHPYFHASMRCIDLKVLRAVLRQPELRQLFRMLHSPHLLAK